MPRKGGMTASHHPVLTVCVVLLALVASSPAPGQTTSPDPRSPGTIRMAERLATIVPLDNPGINPTVGCELRTGYYRAQRDRAPNMRARLNTSLRLANEMLNCGMTTEAIGEFQQVRGTLSRPEARPDPQSYRILQNFLAMSYLRLGEQENCLARHGPDSCLLPIRGGGIHTATRGSQGAIMELTAVLRQNPDDLPARWLLNLAYMTLGQYPDGVPTAWLIPESTFASDYELHRFENAASEQGVDVVGLSARARTCAPCWAPAAGRSRRPCLMIIKTAGDLIGCAIMGGEGSWTGGEHEQDRHPHDPDLGARGPGGPVGGTGRRLAPLGRAEPRRSR